MTPTPTIDPCSTITKVNAAFCSVSQISNTATDQMLNLVPIIIAVLAGIVFSIFAINRVRQIINI